MLQRFENRFRILLKRVTVKRRLPAELGGAAIKVNLGSDVRFINGGWWLPAYHELFLVAREFVRPGDHVWDIGANVGVFTFSALDRIGDTGSVLSLEPDPELSVLLSRTRQRLPHKKASLSKILTVAIADAPGILDLVIPINGSARNHLAGVEGNSAKGIYDRRACLAVSADWLLDHTPAPNFVKIDVEGAEASVLKGATRLLRAGRPAIYIEVNANNSTEVTEIFQRNTYDLFCHSEGSWVSVDRCRFNTLAVPHERIDEVPRAHM